MANEDIQLQAAIDNKQVLDGLDEIEKAIGDMAKKGDASMLSLALHVRDFKDRAVKDLVSLRETGKTTFATIGKEGKKEAITNLEDFRKYIQAFMKDIVQLAGKEAEVDILTFRPGNLALAQERIQRIREEAERLGTVGTKAADDVAFSLTAMADRAEKRFDYTAHSVDRMNEQIAKAEQLAAKFNRALKPEEKVNVAEAIQVPEAKAQLETLKNKAREFLGASSEEAQRFGLRLTNALSIAEDRFDGTSKTAKQFVGDMRTLTTETKKFETGLQKATAQDLTKKLKVMDVRDQMRQLNVVTKEILEKGDAGAKRTAQSLRQMGVDATKAFRDGKITAEQYEAILKAINQRAGKLGDDLEDGVGRGSRGAQVSMWKLGRVMDRVGVRGAGAVFNIVDALKGIPKTAIAAGIAIAGITVVIVKATQAAINLGKQLADMFVNVVKDSTLVAGELETVERQLTNIFKGKQQLARRTLEDILGLSVQFGVDLTGDIAKIWLPMVKSFDQYKEIGEIASTLAIGWGRSAEEIARALKQTAAGRTKSLQEQFGVPAQYIDRIKQYMEELGPTEGLIKGMNEFFEESGRGWDTYEGTLTRVRGSFEQLRKLIENTLGQPVKDALVKQLSEILDLILENEDELKVLFDALGQAVGNAINIVGGAAQRLLSGFDLDQWMQVVESVERILVNIANTIDALVPSESGLDLLTHTLLYILDTVELITLEFRKWSEPIGDALEWLNKLTGSLSGGTAEGRLGRRAGLMDFAMGFATQLGPAFSIPLNMLGLGRTAIDLQYGEQLDEERQALLEIQEARRKDIEAILAGNKAKDDERDQYFELNALLAEYSEAQIAAAEAAETLAEAEAQANQKRADAMEDLETDYARKLLDLQIELSNKRIEEEIRYRRKLGEIIIDYTDKYQDIIIGATFDQTKIFEHSARSRLELEIELSREREEAEIKHQEQLRDIRQRFDFDAQEAIRMNDAVALMRIRRRMQFELNEEREKHSESTAAAERAAEDKRQKLARQLDKELWDLEVNTREKYTTLVNWLSRTLAAEQRNHDNRLVDLQLFEIQKNEEIERWRKQREDDIDKEHERALRDMESRYQEEYDAIARWNKAQYDLELYWYRQRMRLRMRMMTTPHGSVWFGSGLSQIGPTGTGVRFGGGGGQALAMQGGGRFRAGQSLLVGERGPELMLPTQGGLVANHIPLMFSQAAAGGSMIDNSRTITAPINLLDPTHFSPIQMTIIRNIVTDELLRDVHAR